MLQPYPDIPGLWPDFRRDPALSGMQPLAGAIVTPRIVARYDMGGPVFDAHVIEQEGAKSLLVMYGGCLHCCAPDGTQRWKSEAFGVEGIIGVADIDADGVVEIVSANGKGVFVHSAATGERLWHEYLGPPMAGGFIHTCALLHHFPQVGPGMQLAIGLLSSREVMLFDFSAGARQAVRRHIFWMDDFFHPTVLAADLDGDGLDELIVTKYSSVYVFDPDTGALKSQCRWSSGGTPKRNYGLFQVRDLNNDGAPDLLILSYVVSRHLAVVENDGAGTLRNRWDHFIEHVYPHDERELRYTFNSVVDLDGDGRLQAVVSVYNEEGDGRWWLEAYDLWSGERTLRVADLYLHGVHAGDACGPLLLVSAEHARNPREVSTLALMRRRAGRLVTEWECDRAGFVGCFVRSTATSTVFRTDLPPIDEVRHAVVDGTPSFFLRREDGTIALLAEAGEGWQVHDISGTAGTAAVLAVEDLDDDGRTEIVISGEDGSLRAVRRDGSVGMRTRTGMRYRYGASLYFTARPMQTPVVVEEDGERYCIVPDGAAGVRTLRWRDGGFEEVWAGEGRGRVGPEEAHHNVPVVLADGRAATLASAVGDGDAALVARALDGGELRRWDLRALPRTPHVARGRTGIHEFAVMPDGGASLLVVSGFRSGSMNSELTLGVDAASGETRWERVVVGGESEDGRGFGPWNAMAVAGTADAPQVLFLAKDTFCQVDARTGELMRPGWHLRPHNTAHLARRGMTMDDFAAYGTPVPVDVDGDGIDEWFLQANYGGFGVFNPDHSVRWWLSAPLSSVTSAFAGVADIDGDGLLEIGISYADGDFVCLRADTGEERWRLHLGDVASDVITCDIDGDGRMEFVLGTRDGWLMAIGASRNGSGIVRWRLPFGHGLGPPIAADIDGDGRSEVLVVSGDGAVYVVGGLRS